MSKKKWPKTRFSVPRIEAAAPPSDFRICGASEGFELQAQDVNGKAALPTFSMVAYTGVPMRLDGFYLPIIIDLESATAPRQSVPVPRQHDPERILGHTTSIEISPQRVKASGVLSAENDEAASVTRMAKNGFPWQASLGASASRMDFIDKGDSVKVNGRNWDGPLYVARGATIREISLVPMGADGNTATSVAATAPKGEFTMEFDAWIQASGFDVKAMSAEQLTALRQLHAAKPTPAVTPTPAEDPAKLAAKVVADIRASAAAESARVADVARICAKYNGPTMDVTNDGQTQAVSIEAHAIASGWDADKTELHCLRNSRAKNVMTIAKSNAATMDASVLTAALCRSTGLNVDKEFKPETLEACDRHYRTMGLQRLLLTFAAANGYDCSPGERLNDSNLRHVLKAAFSTVTLSGILGNVANKNLLAGYTEEDDTWREISAIKSANNFYQRTYYRMLDNMEYEEVGAAGEIKHGTVDQESYTADLKTYAKMFALTRRDLINDDLGAFDDLRNRIGRGAKKKFNNLFWTQMLANHSTFFTTARTNYITGATTTLLTDGVGLGLGVKAFRQMKTPNSAGSDDGGKRINARPEILLVPPELEYAADSLFMGEKINVGSGPGDSNIYRNKYRPVVNAWLSDSNFTGYSTTAWYLFRSAADMPMMVVSFLNGQQAPTVESADADFSTLGVQFRGYHDFYANQAEYLCGIKSKGAA